MIISARITADTASVFPDRPALLAELTAASQKTKLTLKKKSLLTLDKKPVFIGI